MIAAADLGDAITNFTFEIQAILREKGFQSEIYAPSEWVTPEYRNGRIRPLSECISSIKAFIILLLI